MDSVHDQTDLSQHPAYTVSNLGETARDVRGATGPAKVAETFLVCTIGTSQPRLNAAGISTGVFGGRNGGPTDFKVDLLHVASSLGNVYLILILRVWDNGEDLGRELEWVPLVILRLSGLTSSFVERRAIVR